MSEQAKHTQKRDKLIGNLLDRWEQMPNDVQSQLDAEDANFCRAMRMLSKFVEEQ